MTMVLTCESISFSVSLSLSLSVDLCLCAGEYPYPHKVRRSRAIQESICEAAGTRPGAARRHTPLQRQGDSCTAAGVPTARGQNRTGQSMS